MANMTNQQRIEAVQRLRLEWESVVPNWKDCTVLLVQISPRDAKAILDYIEHLEAVRTPSPSIEEITTKMLAL